MKWPSFYRGRDINARQDRQSACGLNERNRFAENGPSKFRLAPQNLRFESASSWRPAAVSLEGAAGADGRRLNQAPAVLILAASLKQVASMHAPMQTEITKAENTFAPVERIDGPLDAGVVVICDHASNGLPVEYGDLGLARQSLRRHLAYDLGA